MSEITGVDIKFTAYRITSLYDCFEHIECDGQEQKIDVTFQYSYEKRTKYVDYDIKSLIKDLSRHRNITVDIEDGSFIFSKYM